MKVYLGISIGLVVLLILILIIPFSKKPTTGNQPPATNNPLTPTSVETNQPPATNNQPPIAPADFTGVAEEQLPQAVVDASVQKQDLRSKLPISLSSFDIGFNYAEDRFIVTLNEPKDQSRKEFDQWKNNTYPGIETNQFNFR